MFRDTSVLGPGHFSTSADVSSYCTYGGNIAKTVHLLKSLCNTLISCMRYNAKLLASCESTLGEADIFEIVIFGC